MHSSYSVIVTIRQSLVFIFSFSLCTLYIFSSVFFFHLLFFLSLGGKKHTETLWPSSRLDYVFLGWAHQLRGIGNRPAPGPSLHLVFLKVRSWLPCYIYFTLLTLVLSYHPMGY